ncbi:hypothetical protein GCM10010988_04610 [Cnuibacter physcomitrellae]|uniref:Uncharacterized protein n=1 Tax=Cnuibacter physcomitrellae TaxID=1619308 RepID=A0A1X9LQH3_9MICO|nr:hypothetical protein [Cnuibacter physcomitrellae]ARJ05379.1 hypothetical protein B5808_09225 [Cnuibacter physcomitrellae]GGI35575.1 hypothetical protein GCM10010988_04610 [Cnuibacter physcomitrellae]
MPSKRLAVRALAIAASVATVVALSGCSTIMPLFGLQAAPTDPNSTANAAQSQADAATDASLQFASVFTDMGSVHPTTDITDQLELKLDVWTEQKTHDWFYDADKRFSFVIGVYDNRVPAEAPFDQKRRVYMSNITVTAKTTTTSGTVETPYVLNTDPLKVTLDPEALRSDQGLGLLITSPKGGFQLESQQIGVLAPDTQGLMLDFALQVSFETAPGSNAYTTQIVHQYVPVAIFSHTTSTSTPTPTPTPIPIG